MATAVEAGAAITNDPNVGGFGQVDAEIVLQNPVRIYGLLAFFAAVALAQIMLVLKKKQVEKGAGCRRQLLIAMDVEALSPLATFQSPGELFAVTGKTGYFRCVGMDC